MLRWSAEMATKADESERDMGLEALNSLMESPLVDPADTGFVYNLLRAATR